MTNPLDATAFVTGLMAQVDGVGSAEAERLRPLVVLAIMRGDLSKTDGLMECIDALAKKLYIDGYEAGFQKGCAMYREALT